MGAVILLPGPATKKNCAGVYGYEAKPYSSDKDLQYNKFGVNMNDRGSSIKS